MAIDVHDIWHANDTRRGAHNFKIEDDIFRSQQIIETQISFHDEIATINFVVHPTEEPPLTEHSLCVCHIRDPRVQNRKVRDPEVYVTDRRLQYILLFVPIFRQQSLLSVRKDNDR